MTDCGWCGRQLNGRAKKWCSDNCRKRAWEHKYRRSPEGRGYCERCGQLMGIGAAVHGHTTCPQCIHDEADHKARIVERLWNEGRSGPEIQEAMSWSKHMFDAMMDRYRQQGYHLPYRYRNGSKFPELAVKAKR